MSGDGGMKGLLDIQGSSFFDDRPPSTRDTVSDRPRAPHRSRW
ncbi:hypothetical protein B005_4444 [Nocardiopsis alba ATCC BAA-2165]|uniref:Uncharacterized protein n=1 Tax=Nocardiopsis alba (strain ATCC BAA-2165 / BE74) TaxID=1205910 RepID=J7L8X6_NOCAA|nr:hypothetical protein B005_4444 [Nocardiopsis alba ATCC BAA-2165]